MAEAEGSDFFRVSRDVLWLAFVSTIMTSFSVGLSSTWFPEVVVLSLEDEVKLLLVTVVIPFFSFTRFARLGANRGFFSTVLEHEVGLAMVAFLFLVGLTDLADVVEDVIPPLTPSSFAALETLGLHVLSTTDVSEVATGCGRQF